MSCGSPHATPCAEVLSWVYDFLDGEIDERSRALVVAHLDECPPCLQQYSLEKAVKALVHRSCCQESAPAELRVRVIARIQEIRVTYRRG
ncbi:MAG: mycothiol system anti-sigma-R factor [Candidatus Nanopelagicales bacterium]